MFFRFFSSKWQKSFRYLSFYPSNPHFTSLGDDFGKILSKFHVSISSSFGSAMIVSQSVSQFLLLYIYIYYIIYIDDNFWEKNLCHSRDSNHRSPFLRTARSQQHFWWSIKLLTCGWLPTYIQTDRKRKYSVVFFLWIKFMLQSDGVMQEEINYYYNLY